MKRTGLIRAATLVATALFASTLEAQTVVTYVGPATGGLWSNSANWSGGVVPINAGATTCSVIVPSNFSVTFDLFSPATISNLQIDPSNSVVNLASGANLGVLGMLSGNVFVGNAGTFQSTAIAAGSINNSSLRTSADSPLPIGRKQADIGHVDKAVVIEIAASPRTARLPVRFEGATSTCPSKFALPAKVYLTSNEEVSTDCPLKVLLLNTALLPYPSRRVLVDKALFRLLTATQPARSDKPWRCTGSAWTRRRGRSGTRYSFCRRVAAFKRIMSPAPRLT